MARLRRSRDRERYKVLKQMLEDRRGEIREKLRFLRETLPAEIGDVKDAEEQSVADFVQDVDFALMQMKSDTLHRIDEAIQRLEAGCYGHCSECGGEIAEARLSALPFAERCRSCQELEESKGAGDRDVEIRFLRELSPSLR